MPPKKTSRHVSVVGSDEGLVKEHALEWAAQLTPPNSGDFGLEQINGIADNAEHASHLIRNVCLSLDTMPFFGEKLVWLKQPNFLADDVLGRSTAVKDGLEKLGKLIENGIPEGVTLLLSATSIDKRRTFYKILDKHTSLLRYDLPDAGKKGADAARQLTLERAKRTGLRFQGDSLERFLTLTGHESKVILNELEKLDLYLGPEDRLVTTDLVTQLAPQTQQTVIWELGNAIGAGSLKLAVEQVDRLFEQKESGIGILLAAIVPKIRNLLAAKLLVEDARLRVSDYRSFEAALNHLPETIIAQLPKKKDGSGLNVYPLFLAAQEASRFSSDDLFRAQRSCLDTNLALVSSGIDEKIILLKLLVQIIPQKHTRRAS